MQKKTIIQVPESSGLFREAHNYRNIAKVLPLCFSLPKIKNKKHKHAHKLSQDDELTSHI